MKVIQDGKVFRIYGDDLKVGDALVAGTYIVRFHPMKGFFLETYSELNVSEEKIYGVHLSKVQKVMRSFKNFERSLGVILSGDKGIGKSLFARILCNSCIEAGYPVIVVDSFEEGLHSFLEQIQQEVVVLFDEFDKKFSNCGDGGGGAQASMLSLFDGVSAGKRLYLITCNEYHTLNEFLINRPGRFHYHFRFAYPTADEIRTYLSDKIDEKYWGEIQGVVEFAGKTGLNYDCLRAIAYELQQGEPFQDAIKDLNIINVGGTRYDLFLEFEDGEQAANESVGMDMYLRKRQVYWVATDSRETFYVKFTPSKAKYDPDILAYVVDPKDLEVSPYEDSPDEIEFLKKHKPQRLVIKRCIAGDIHYTF